MKFTKIALITLVISAYSVSAQAQDSGAYANLGVILYDDDPDLSGIEAKLGYSFNKYFGVEAQGSIGTNRESDTIDSVTVDAKVDYSLAAFAVARLPLGKKFEVFARGGLHNTQASVEIEDGSIPDFDLTETGLAVGGGVQYNFNKKHAIRYEYTYLDDIDANTYTLSYVRKF